VHSGEDLKNVVKSYGDFEMGHQKRGLGNRHTRFTQGYPNLSRRILPALILVVLTGVALIIQAWGPVEAVKEGENRSMIKTQSAPSVVRPPIDASAPAKTETATFALG
jgi:hypothetical protein